MLIREFKRYLKYGWYAYTDDKSIGYRERTKEWYFFAFNDEKITEFPTTVKEIKRYLKKHKIYELWQHRRNPNWGVEND